MSLLLRRSDAHQGGRRKGDGRENSKAVLSHV
jgi:hypothetical protein